METLSKYRSFRFLHILLFTQQFQSITYSTCNTKMQIISSSCSFVLKPLEMIPFLVLQFNFYFIFFQKTILCMHVLFREFGESFGDFLIFFFVSLAHLAIMGFSNQTNHVTYIHKLNETDLAGFSL